MVEAKRIRVDDISETLVSSVNINFPETRDWLLPELEDFVLDTRHNILLMCFDGEEPVGYLTAYILKSLKAERYELFLYEIEVTPDYKGKGIGTKLIDALKSFALQEGISEIFVFTEESNTPAMKFYEKNGAVISNKGEDVLFTFKVHKTK